MSSQAEKTKKTLIMITDAPVTNDPSSLINANWLNLSCTLKETNFTAGQKNDIDNTTFCSEETENLNGLPAPSELSLSGNFFRNPAQDALRDAYDNDTVYGFKIIFPSGNGFLMRAEVRQHTWSASVNAVVAATFSLRLKGKPQQINATGALSFSADLSDSLSVPEGDDLTLSVSVTGGVIPYTYVWEKDGQAISGQTEGTLTKSGATTDDDGTYSCVVTDSATPPNVITSAECTVIVD